MDERHLVDTIDLIYASSLDPTLWPEALHRMARTIGGAGAVMLPCSMPAAVLQFTSPDLTDGAAAYVRDAWYERDPPLIQTQARGLTSGLFADTDLVDRSVLDRHPFYQEFLGRYGSGRVFSLLTTPMPGHTICLTTHREAHRGDPTPEERRLYALLGHHASRAATLSLQLSARQLGSDLADALAHRRDGIAVVDPKGRLVFANRAMEGFAPDGIRLSGQSFRLTHPARNAALQRMIATAAGGNPFKPGADYLALPRDDLRRPVMLRVLPLPVIGTTSGFLDLFGGALSIVIAIDLDHSDDKLPIRSLVALGLTPAQARVAALVGSGQTPREAAEALGISENTTRQHLKQVFQKLSIRRQSELARLTERLASLDRLG